MTGFYGSQGGGGGRGGSGSSGGFGGAANGTAARANGAAGQNKGGGGGGAGTGGTGGGGTGGTGGAGGYFGGGAGGNGGATGVTLATSTATTLGGGTGGAGANGAYGANASGGGGGGGGGIGVNGPTFTSTLTLTGAAVGGAGGNSGGSSGPSPGNGGNGGVGVVVQSGTVVLGGGASITGGAGGVPGPSTSTAYTGARGGEGLVFTDTNAPDTLTTAAGARITGGAGGAGASRTGQAVLGSYLTLNNAGTITGGASSNGAGYGADGVRVYQIHGSNSGSIAGGAGGSSTTGSPRTGGTGINLSTGDFTNTATGVIMGGGASGSGVASGGDAFDAGTSSLTNQGLIQGGADTTTGGSGVGGVALTSAGSVVNSGTIRGGSGRTGGEGLVASGATIVNTGTIAGGSGSVAAGNALDIASTTSTLTLSTAAGVGTISGDIFLQYGTLQVDPGTASSVTLSNVIKGPSASNGLVKLGASTLVLTGASTFSGATAVSAGTLEVDGTLASDVTIASGATLRGTGSTTGGNVTTSAGGVFAPGGATGTGTFGIGGNLSLASGSTFREAISSVANYGSVNVNTGGGYTLTLAGTLNLSVRAGAVIPVGTVFTLIHEAGFATTSGTFSGQAEGSSITTGGYTFTVSYVGGTSHHDVTLTETVAPPAPVYTVTVLNASPSQATDDASTTRPFTGVTISDTGGGAETVALTYTAANGQLSGAGFTHSAGSSTGSFASAAAAQAAIQSLVFTPTANQVPPGQTVQTTFGVSVTDTDVGVSGSGSDQVTATSVNDVPRVTGTHASSTDDRATDSLFSGVTVVDPDQGQSETATLTYTAANGTLTYGGAGGGALTGTAGSYTLAAGSAAALTTALQSLSFAPATAPAGTPATTTRVSVSVSDGLAASSPDTATVVTATHTTNTPVQAANGSTGQSLDDKHTTNPFASVTVTDPDLGQSYTAVVTYAAANGTLSGAGAGAIAGTTATYTIAASSPAALQSALQAVVFTPTADQVTPGARVQTTFTVQVGDGASTAAVTDTASVLSINDAPALGGTHASTTDDRAGDPLFSGVTVTDPDKGQTETATLTYTAANGTLSYGGAGGGTLSGSAGAYTLAAGSAAALTTALQSLSFAPATAPAGTPATTTRVSLTVSDGTASSGTDTATVVTATHTTNTPVQAANGSAGQGIDDKHTTTPFAAVTVTDPDLGQAYTAVISYAAANGVLSGAGAASVAGGTATYTVSGASTSALQSALQAVVFTPTADQVTPGARVQTTFTVQVGDGSSTSTVTDTAVVTSVNDTPVLGGGAGTVAATAPGSVVLQPGLTISDPDAGAAVSSAQIVIGGYVAGDKLSVGSAPGGVGVAFDSTNGVLTLTGAASDAAYQAALRSVAFSPAAVGSGARTISFTVTDDQSATSAPLGEAVSVTPYTPPASTGGGGGGAVPSNLSAQQGFSVQLGNLTRASGTDPALSDPSSPLFVQAQAEKAIAAQLDAGVISLADAQNALYHLVDGTVSVAEIDYAFFTGKTPTAAGLNYLVHSSANPTDLNDAYYAKFSTENRYINFAANLASGAGPGAAAFQASYGGLSLADATSRAYQAVFGFAPTAGKVDAILNAPVSNGQGGTETRAQYLADITGGSTLAQKAAVVGFLLADSVKEGFGAYQQADIHFLQDLARGTAVFNIDLLGAYTAAPTLVGQPTVDATLGS